MNATSRKLHLTAAGRRGCERRTSGLSRHRLGAGGWLPSPSGGRRHLHPIRSIFIKMMLAAVLIAVVPTSRGETWPAEHAWVLGSDGNYYGLVQWDDSRGTISGPKRKRTVIYLGAFEFTVHLPAVLVAGVGLFGLSSFVLVPLSIGSWRRKRHRNETAD